MSSWEHGVLHTVPLLGIYNVMHGTFPSSTRFVSITMEVLFCCQTISQKSFSVLSVGPAPGAGWIPVSARTLNYPTLVNEYLIVGTPSVCGRYVAGMLSLCFWYVVVSGRYVVGTQSVCGRYVAGMLSLCFWYVVVSGRYVVRVWSVSGACW